MSSRIIYKNNLETEGTIKRVNGEIEITLQYSYDSENCSYEEKFPNEDGYVVVDGKLEIGVKDV